MTKIQHYRTTVAGRRPTGRVFGEIWINSADKVMGYIDATGAPVVNTVKKDGDTMTGNLTIDATDANINLKAGQAGTTGAVNWTLYSTNTVFGSLSLPYDTRGTVGLKMETVVGYPITINAGYGVIFQKGGTTETMRITDTGRVGIGSSAPTEKLSVVGRVIASTNETDATDKQGFFGVKHYINAEEPFVGLHHYVASGINALYLGGGSNDANAATQISFNTAATSTTVNGTERIRIDSAGNVGVGTTNPTYQLHLSTDSAAKPSTNTWTIASDGRLKNETGEYTKGLDAVCGLRPITYTYNGKGGFTDTTTENISIIAQEAQKHFPECVGSVKGEIDGVETDILNWNGHALTFALVNAVKELKAKIETLEARVAQLEGK